MDFERMDLPAISYERLVPLERSEVNLKNGRVQRTEDKARTLGAYASLMNEAPETVYAVTEACAQARDGRSVSERIQAVASNMRRIREDAAAEDDGASAIRYSAVRFLESGA